MGTSKLYVHKISYLFFFMRCTGLTSQCATGIFQFLQVKGILVPCIWILFVVSTTLNAGYLIGSAYLI